MAEWFFRKKSKDEVGCDHARDEYFTSNRSTSESPMHGKGFAEQTNQWKDGEE